MCQAGAALRYITSTEDTAAHIYKEDAITARQESGNKDDEKVLKFGMTEAATKQCYRLMFDGDDFKGQIYAKGINRATTADVIRSILNPILMHNHPDQLTGNRYALRPLSMIRLNLTSCVGDTV